MRAVAEIRNVYGAVASCDDILRTDGAGQRLRVRRLSFRIFRHRTGAEVADVQRPARIDIETVGAGDRVGDLPGRRARALREYRDALIGLVGDVQLSAVRR